MLSSNAKCPKDKREPSAFLCVPTSTTALGTIDPKGRELGLKVGANVVMPNLSPADVRDQYSLYDNKLSTGEESAQSLDLLRAQVLAAGFRIVTDIGDVKR